MKFVIKHRNERTPEDKHLEELKSWFFIKTITAEQLRRGLKSHQDIPEWKDLTFGEDGGIDIEFKINGVELNFEEVIQNLEIELNYVAGKKARRLLDERVGKLWDELHDKVDKVTDWFDDQSHHLKEILDPEDEWEY